MASPSSTNEAFLASTRVSEAMSTAVTSILAATDEAEAWSATLGGISELFSPDGSLVFEIMADDRAAARATRSIPITLNDEFPIAPDSQAAYVLARNQAVVSADLLCENRFVAGSLITRFGIRSSISIRLRLGADCWGVLGTYWTTPGAGRDVDVGELELFAQIAGSQIAQLRLRRTLEVTARRDSLTGILSREASIHALTERLGGAHRTTVLIIDLDGFKSVNDDLGHFAGDLVLKTIATRIDRAVPVGQVVGRLGGDEFIVVLDSNDVAPVMRLSSRLVGSIEEAIAVDHRVIQVSASVGVARAESADTAAELIRRADTAMYAAKAAGRGQVHLAKDRRRTPRVPTGRPPQAKTTSGRDGPCDLDTVEEAIAGLRMVVQPIVESRTQSVVGVEALARGPIGHRLEFPDDLFAIATTFGRLGELELEAKRLAFTMPLPEHIQLFVNLEPILLTDPEWLDALQLVWVQAATKRPIVAEITERAVLASPGRLLAAVEACRRLGWRIALDDIGARTESLAALRWIRPDIIKLDTGLIHDQNTAHCSQVAAAVAAYRDGEEVEVVAEGVETDRHLELTSLVGADLIQGYLVGRPAPLADIDFDRRLHLSTFDAVDADSSERIATKADLLGLSRHVESVALTSDTVLLAALQRAEFLSLSTRRQYAAIARRCGFVGLLGQDLIAAASSTMPGAHIADLAAEDPLIRTWQVVAIAPTTSIALVATEIDTIQPVEDMNRLFRYRLITARDAVDRAARELLRYF